MTERITEVEFDGYALDSKAALKANRREMWRTRCERAGLYIEQWPFWVEEEKRAERLIWQACDEIYEQRKANLKARVKSLSAEGRAHYFRSVGLDEDTDPEAYLAGSLHGYRAGG